MPVHGAQSSRWDHVFEEIARDRAYSYGSFITAVAGQIAHLQLFNPLGSARTLHVFRAEISHTIAGEWWCARYDTALTTLLSSGISLQTGLATASGEMRSQSSAAGVLGTPLHRQLLLANTPWTPISSWWQQLGAGQGLLFATMTAGATIYVRFDWIEKDA